MSEALNIFVKRFIKEQGFPFPVKLSGDFDLSHPKVLHARIENGIAIVPAQWRDKDDEAEEDRYSDLHGLENPQRSE